MCGLEIEAVKGSTSHSTQDNVLKLREFIIQHGEWDEHEHEGSCVFQGNQLLGVVSDGENHGGKQRTSNLEHEGEMKQELQTVKRQVEKRVLALMIKLWNQMINKKKLKIVS
ncbi:hypothetical protein IGI04_043004 [Brassica rapa subsp. trilocularis]|uniref:Uncharacterized protein n=1 Tax=Brassica rapa subsp. trilocularis TaxID=1813537 RepID=A0ABQ7KL37_BRACM|nr:hypothetical protein IGI04_043004 [Brassica rapa subsp. trilocularis]